MKSYICLAFIILMSTPCYADSAIFLRVFDLTGKKTAKGNLSATTDSSIILNMRDKRTEIPFSKIGYIKTHHSTGNHILISSLIIGGLTAGFLLATNDRELWLKNEAALMGVGFLLGGINGTALGGLIGAVKVKSLFIVRGNKEAWKNIKRELDLKLLQ